MYSRIPVYSGSPDEIVGLLHVKVRTCPRESVDPLGQPGDAMFAYSELRHFGPPPIFHGHLRHRIWPLLTPTTARHWRR